MFYHPSISYSHAIYPVMKLSVLWILLLLVQNALEHLFSDRGYSSLPALYHWPTSNQDQRLVLFTQVPHGTCPSCLEYLQQYPAEECDQQFGSLSTAELSTARGKHCQKQHRPQSWGASGANLLGTKGILPSNTQSNIQHPPTTKDLAWQPQNGPRAARSMNCTETSSSASG